MRSYLWKINIRKGSESLEIARGQRKGEEPLFDLGLEWLRKELRKVGRKQQSQPYLIIHLCEGATSLSVLLEWLPRIYSEVANKGGFAIYMMNIGDKIGTITDDEYLKRKEVIMALMNEKSRPPLIVTTNCFRLGDQIIYDKGHFDERYLEAAYVLDRTAIGQPLREDLSNLLQPGSVHTITTPVKTVDFEDLMKNHIEKTSFMFAGAMGTGKPAPLLSEGEGKVDGVVLIANTEDYLRNVMLSFESKWLGRRIVAYSMADVKRAKLSVPFIPKISAREPIKEWGKESFFGFFTATLNVNDVEEALERTRTTFKARQQKR